MHEHSCVFSSEIKKQIFVENIFYSLSRGSLSFIIFLVASRIKLDLHMNTVVGAFSKQDVKADASIRLMLMLFNFNEKGRVHTVWYCESPLCMYIHF